MKTGDIVHAKVTNILGYGAFVKVDEYDGLVHISEFSDGFVRKINEFVNIGDEIRVIAPSRSFNLLNEETITTATKMKTLSIVCAR